MEAAWYRLHSISGAATPDQVIAYWEGTPTSCFQTVLLNLCVLALRKPSNPCLPSYKLIGWNSLLDNTLQDLATPISTDILNCAQPCTCLCKRRQYMHVTSRSDFWHWTSEARGQLHTIMFVPLRPCI